MAGSSYPSDFVALILVPNTLIYKVKAWQFTISYGTTPSKVCKWSTDEWSPSSFFWPFNMLAADQTIPPPIVYYVSPTKPYTVGPIQDQRTKWPCTSDIDLHEKWCSSISQKKQNIYIKKKWNNRGKHNKDTYKRVKKNCNMPYPSYYPNVLIKRSRSLEMEELDRSSGSIARVSTSSLGTIHFSSMYSFSWIFGDASTRSSSTCASWAPSSATWKCTCLAIGQW